MHSHHSHSGQFCEHAKDSLEAVVQEAVRQGFTTFGLSEHAPRYREEDLFPEEVEAGLTPADLSRVYLAFLREALRLKAAYAGRIALLVGVETDVISAVDVRELGALLAAHPEIDYVVGSVHHVGGVSIDLDRATWLRALADCGAAPPSTTMARDGAGALVLAPLARPGGVREPAAAADIAAFACAYLDAQHALITAHAPEVVGHFDLCVLFTPALSLAARADTWARVRRNVAAAAAYGALFEANAAAFRKGWTTAYPAPDVLRLILEVGGRICLSDDSHGVAAVGQNYARLREYLVQHGVTRIWHLVPAAEGGEPVGTRGRVRARPLADWDKAQFWDTAK